MASIVFVTGLQESGMDTVMDMVLEGSRNSLEKLKHIRFSNLGLGRLGESPARDIRKARDLFYKSVERQVSDALKSGMSVVLEGPLTLKTGNGYLPLVPSEFFESFAPEAIMLFEVQADKGQEADMTQQQINRAYAAMHASLSGCSLKLVQIAKGRVKDSIKESTEVMLSVLGRL